MQYDKSNKFQNLFSLWYTLNAQYTRAITVECIATIRYNIIILLRATWAHYWSERLCTGADLSQCSALILIPLFGLNIDRVV